MTNTMTAEAVQFNIVDIDKILSAKKQNQRGIYRVVLLEAQTAGYAIKTQIATSGAFGIAANKFIKENNLPEKSFKAKVVDNVLYIKYVPVYETLTVKPDNIENVFANARTVMYDIDRVVREGWLAIKDGKYAGNAIKKYVEKTGLKYEDFRTIHTEAKGNKYLLVLYMPKYNTLKK